MAFFDRGFRGGRPGALGLGLAVGALALSARAEPAPPPALVELRGEVAEPGFWELGSPQVGRALSGLDAAPPPGARLVQSEEGVRLDAGANALLFGRLLSLNEASAAELEALPGVGPSLAGAIVADRAARGPFRRYEDLDRVRGIGPAKLAELRPYVSVSP